MDGLNREDHDTIHDEYAKRMDAENARQNKRLDLLEEGTVRQINSLTVSIEKMAVNVANMLEEQKRQGERLDELEKEPAETLRQIKMSAVTALVGTVVGVIVTAALMLL